MQMRIMTKEQQELVLNNINLVHYIVQKINLDNHMYEDNVSVGIFGLIKAVMTFDESKNIKFATYAAKCIQNEIFMLLRKSRKKQEKEVSTTTVIVEDGNLTLEGMIPSTEEEVEDQIIRNDSLERSISIILNGLTPREAACIFYKIAGKTQQETAEVLHLSQSYISKIEISVMSKIAAYIEKKTPTAGEFIVKKAYDGAYEISSSNKEIICTIAKALKSIEKSPYCKVECSEDLITIRIMPYEECFEFMAEVAKSIEQKPKPEKPKPKRSKSKKQEVMEYILEIGGPFSVKELSQHFSDFSEFTIYEALKEYKKKGKIEAVSKGVYRVKEN